MSATPSQPNDPGVPVAYAGADGISDRPAGESLWRPPRLAVASGVLLVVMLLGTLVDSSGVFLPLLLLTWPLSIGVLIGAAAVVRRNLDLRLPQHEGRSRARAWGTLAFSFIILIAQTLVAGQALARVRMATKSPVTAANLRGLGQAIQVYGREHGEYPADFDILIALGECAPNQLIAFSDPTRGALGEPNEPPSYSSFVYRAGRGKPICDPVLVIAFERERWEPEDARLLTKWARWVLFGDGRVELLDDKGFASALRRDAERRRELGWPVPPAP